MPPNVNIRSLEAADTAAGTPAQFTVEVNNRETVTPLFGPAACGGVIGSSQGHKTEVSIEVRDSAGRVIDESSQEVCAPGEQIGNEVTVEFDAETGDPGEHTGTAATRVGRNELESDTAGPVSFDVADDAGDLPSSDGGGGAGLPDLPDPGDNDSPLDLGLPSGKALVAVAALLAVAWLADSAEGITS